MNFMWEENERTDECRRKIVSASSFCCFLRGTYVDDYSTTYSASTDKDLFNPSVKLLMNVDTANVHTVQYSIAAAAAFEGDDDIYCMVIHALDLIQ